MGAGEELVDGLQCGVGVWLGGPGDGTVTGMDASTPVGAKAAGDLSEHHRWPEFPLGDVVGGRDLAVLREDEEVGAPGLDRGLQITPRVVRRWESNERVDAAFGAGVVTAQGRVLERLSSAVLPCARDVGRAMRTRRGEAPDRFVGLIAQLAADTGAGRPWFTALIIALCRTGSRFLVLRRPRMAVLGGLLRPPQQRLELRHSRHQAFNQCRLLCQQRVLLTLAQAVSKWWSHAYAPSDSHRSRNRKVLRNANPVCSSAKCQPREQLRDRSRDGVQEADELLMAVPLRTLNAAKKVLVPWRF